MQVNGFLRFSFMGKQDTILGRSFEKPNADYAEILFAPDRLAARMFYFEHITLPSLARQSDQDFRFYILSSEMLPEIYKEKLNALCQSLPQILLRFTARSDMFASFEEMVSIRSDVKSVNFRLDDDDALARTFIADLREDAERLDHGSLITYPKGFTAEIGADEHPRIIRKFEPYIAIGLALVSNPGGYLNPFGIAHKKTHRRRVCYSDPNSYKYFHLIHPYADTAGFNVGKLNEAQQFDPRYDKPRRQKLNCQGFDEAFGIGTAVELAENLRIGRLKGYL